MKVQHNAPTFNNIETSDLVTVHRTTKQSSAVIASTSKTLDKSAKFKTSDEKIPNAAAAEIDSPASHPRISADEPQFTPSPFLGGQFTASADKHLPPPPPPNHHHKVDVRKAQTPKSDAKLNTIPASSNRRDSPTKERNNHRPRSLSRKTKPNVKKRVANSFSPEHSHLAPPSKTKAVVLKQYPMPSNLPTHFPLPDHPPDRPPKIPSQPNYKIP
jgi:hypothetical protein